MEPSKIMHPDYSSQIAKWEKYRYTMKSGADFIERYLQKFSVREDDTDFADRKKITYCPAHAKSAITETQNSIYERMIDVIRESSINNYNIAVNGKNGGVDLNGNTMTSFIGRIVLEDLLAIGKVGVYIDKQYQEPNSNLAEAKKNRPYLYKYNAEEILSWSYNNNNQLQTLLLKHSEDYEDPDQGGLVTKTVVTYRFFRLTVEGVEVEIYDENNKQLDMYLLELESIPFVIFEISNSLLTDIADYQISFLNLASSDMNYSMKSNFPFYTEQYNAAAEMAARQASNTGEASEAKKAEDTKIQVGASHGRRYPMGMERPSFINPSPEPLRVSMEKQKQLKQEIRELTQLAITKVTPMRASAESKAFDERGLEAGLSAIGLTLEFGENKILDIWADYEGTNNNGTVSYPRKYDLRTEDERRKEAQDLLDMLNKIPSVTVRKAILKFVIITLIGYKLTKEEYSKITKEIDALENVVDHTTLMEDHQEGLVGDNLASKLSGYPIGEIVKAQKDHAERATRILTAQTNQKEKIGSSEPANRGVSDLDANQG